MGWCKIRKSSGKWQAGYRDPNGKQHVKGGFDTKKDGVAWFTLQEASVVKGGWRDPAEGNITFADYWTQRFPWPHLTKRTAMREGTQQQYRRYYEAHLAPFFGDMKMGKIDRATIRRFVRSMDGLSANVQLRQLTILASVFKLAIRDEVIVIDPMLNVEKPLKTKRADIHAPDLRSLHALADEVDDRFRALVLLLGYCGLRFGEAAALTVDDFDSMTGALTISKTTVELTGEGVVIQDCPKGGQTRKVQVPTMVRDAMVEHLERYRDGDVIFTGPRTDRPLRKSFLPQVLQPAATAIGYGHIKTHWLRHTAVAIMVSAGWDMLSISRVLGHSSTQITEQNYGYLFPSYSDELVKRLDDAFVDGQAQASNVIALRR